MKILKKSLLVLLALILIWFAFAFSLPHQYGVTRSIVIQAKPQQIYGLIVAPKEWKKWSVWNQRDPQMQITYSGPEQGKGAKWDWKSQSEGNGGMVLLDVGDNQVVNYQLHFEGMGKPSAGSIMLDLEGDQTKVTWSMTGSTEGEWMMKLFVPFMDRMVGPDFEKGLANLKQLVEKSPSK